MDFFDYICYTVCKGHVRRSDMADTTLFQNQSDLFENTDIGMYYCGKRVHTLNHVYGPEIRNYYLFLLVNKGEASFFHKNGTIKLEEHDMLVMCPGEKIHYVAHTPWSIQWVGLYGQTVERYMRLLSINGDEPILHIERYYEMEQVFEELYRLSGQRTEYFRCKQIEGIYKFFSLLLESSSQRTRYDIAHSARKILDYNFDHALTIQQIANTLCVDGAYLTRKFIQKYNISPKEYLMEKRIERAKKLLAETDVSVKEISVSVGYVDQLYFSRLFKKKEGISPQAYRKQKE